MPNILIVDDDCLAAAQFSRILKQFGYQASAASCGDAALTQLSQALTDYDLVFLDVMMPGMNGLEVLRRIRSDDRTADVPVIMYSALDDDGWRWQAQRAGANDYWLKGTFDYGELEERVRAAMPC